MFAARRPRCVWPLAAGLPDTREYKFHVLRKSVASHYEAAGGNATDLLKHSSRKVTLTYLDPRVVRPAAPVDLLFRPGETEEK
jgi:integrase